MTDTEKATELLKALILPREAKTAAELDALEAAAGIQAEYMQEAGEGLAALSQSNDGVSVSKSYMSAPFGICAAARAVLRNAGLLRSGFPRARAI